MNITLLSKYSRLGASSRLRSLQYLPYLSACGLRVASHPLFDDRYLQELYASEGRSKADVLNRYLRRIRHLSEAGHSSQLLWLEYEVFPWVPWSVERLLMPRNLPYVVDYDDAIFHQYDGHRSQVVRAGLGGKIDNVMRQSALVMAGNDYLAQRADAAGARQVELVPTVVDVETYSIAEFPSGRDTPIIGWVGSPSTWRRYMQPMAGVFAEVADRVGATVSIVGAKPTASTQGRFQFVPWSEADEVAQIQAMDIGIMPLADTSWARGKCGYKLIQYMACGLPVVASPVGVNSNIVEHGVNGFLASSKAEWRDALMTLACDPVLRQSMGKAGRAKVEAEYSLQVWAPKVARLMLGVT